MSLDAVDTIKSTFGSLNSETGLRILGLMFAVQLVNMSSSMMIEAGTTIATAAGALLTVLAALAGVVITLGALRSFDTGTLEREQYTENLLMPVIRLMGANIVTTVLGYGLAVLAFIPAILAAGSVGIGMSSAAAFTSASIPMLVIGVIGFALGIAAFLYVFLTLMVSVPMIAADNNRLFESLDRSVQRTRENKVSMLISLLPIALVYLIGVMVIVLLAPSMQGTMSVPFAVGASAVSSIIAVLVLSLLTEFNQRLPE